MKMARVTAVAVLLLCCSAVTAADSPAKCEKYVAIGDSFTVPLNHKLQSTERLEWKRDTTVIFSRRKANEVRVGKAEDISADGSLKLTNVQENMSGTYKPEVFNETGHGVKNLKSLNLCVIARVKKPKVTMKCQKSKVIFTCMAEESSHEWLQNNKTLNEKEKSLKSLTKEAKDVSADSFTCRVSNQVSSLTSEPVTQTCYKGGFPEKLFGVNIWIIVGGGAGIVVVLIIIVICCCVQARKKKRMRLKDEEELRLGWANPEQPQVHQQYHQPSDHHHHHYHHHHQQQQPADHTGPRQPRSQQPRKQHQRPRAPDPTNGHPQPSPRRVTQNPAPTGKADDDEPPPLPNPRKKGPRTQKV